MKFESCKRQSSDLDFFLFPVAMETWESSFRCQEFSTDLNGKDSESSPRNITTRFKNILAKY